MVKRKCKNIVKVCSLLFLLIIIKEKSQYGSGVAQLFSMKTKQSIWNGLSEEHSNRVTDNSRYEVPVNHTDRKRFIFALRYFEQLTGGVINLLAFASLATHMNRHIVMPFVKDARFHGIRNKGFVKAPKNRFYSFDRYFDVNHLNIQLMEHGYTTLAPFDEFQSQCRTINVVIHFLYVDPNQKKQMGKWYKVLPDENEEIIQKAKSNHGWIECDFVKRSKISKLLGDINVTKYTCVDPEVLRSVQELEKYVLRNASCVGIMLWKGDGRGKTHFPLAPQINKPLRPLDFKHSPRLIEIAYRYVRDTIKGSFISVHVRSEMLLKNRRYEYELECIKNLSKLVFQRKMKFNIKNIFLASDLEEHGSDTLAGNINKIFLASDSEVLASDTVISYQQKIKNTLQTELTSGLGRPFQFNPSDYGVTDHGEIAIVEQHILSLGESLFTLGGGRFQNWTIDIFRMHNGDDNSFIYSVCTV